MIRALLGILEVLAAETSSSIATSVIDGIVGNNPQVLMDPEQEFYTALKRNAKKYSDRKVMIASLRAIEAIHRRAWALNFESEGTYLGSKWQPLKENTVEKKRKKRELGDGGDPRILRDYGYLYSSIADRKDINAKSRIRGNKIYFGTKIPYAYTHQVGSSFPDIPARPFVYTGHAEGDVRGSLLIQTEIEKFLNKYFQPIGTDGIDPKNVIPQVGSFTVVI